MLAFRCPLLLSSFSFRFAFSCSVSLDHVQLPKQSITYSKFIYHLFGQNNHHYWGSSFQWSRDDPRFFVYVIQGHTTEHLLFYKIFQRLANISNYFWELVTFVIELYYIFLGKKGKFLYSYFLLVAIRRLSNIMIPNKRKF